MSQNAVNRKFRFCKRLKTIVLHGLAALSVLLILFGHIYGFDHDGVLPGTAYGDSFFPKSHDTKTSTKNTIYQLEELYEPYCADISHWITKDRDDESNVYAHVKNFDSPLNFNITVCVDRDGNVTRMWYKMDLDESMTMEENIQKFKAQFNLFHGAFLEVHMPIVSGNLVPEILLSDEFYQEISETDAKEDVFVIERMHPKINFQYDVADEPFEIENHMNRTLTVWIDYRN